MSGSVVLFDRAMKIVAGQFTPNLNNHEKISYNQLVYLYVVNPGLENHGSITCGVPIQGETMTLRGYPPIDQPGVYLSKVEPLKCQLTQNEH